ncbi:MAG: hypothetical protein ACOYEK_02975 [bacterium]
MEKMDVTGGNTIRSSGALTASSAGSAI